MQETISEPSITPTAPREWNAILAPYRSAVLWSSVWQLASTVTLFVGFWAAMYASLQVGYWLTLLLAIPTAMMIVRLFMLQHDCGHGSFFNNKIANTTVGSLLGVVTLVPFSYWRKTHAIHHATNGDLDGRDLGDIDTLTVKEYLSRPKAKRIAYRIYRHPAVLLIVGPIWQFILKHRWPFDAPKQWRREWVSVHFTNAALVAASVALASVIGWKAFLLIQLPASIIAGAFGIYLFYVQHQYEDTYWRYREAWNYYASGLEGSSHLVMPKWMQWATANIGLHHIHHIASKIPNYRLQDCFDNVPALQQVTTLTLPASVKTLWLTLWDEDAKQLVRFRDLKRIRARLEAELEMGARIMATKSEAVPATWR
jgi:omega-6 fatty acid desaturase (delta-12 desaturase)